MTYLIFVALGAMLGIAFGSRSPVLVGAREKRSTWSLVKGRPQDCFITALYMPPRLRLPLLTDFTERTHPISTKGPT